ncbi:MAG: hypothetical protein L6N96_01585, partial [Candidatus Methylarchaceae archaeon HK02M2]|nr:hypothetical protein [Candidatus Methylarchaceae archaeon HK02M2]
ICPTTSKDIQDFIKKIEKNYDLSKPDSDLSKEDKQHLLDISTFWLDRLIEKSEKLDAVLLDNKYTLNPELLKKGAVSFLPRSVWRKLTIFTRMDLNESCKCILFELPTSGGYHALRATECVLREYYEKKTGKAIKGFIDWKKILDELEKIADSSLLGHLDYLRENLRNKLSHPEAFLSQKEAEKILPMIFHSIETMVKDF